mmetsp:Transcript_775/g.2601  ORF Transcript_775/g.2601 Transcript_775/m.2601 type:complete len:566 (-) Transcript_775:87-1784(-)
MSPPPPTISRATAAVSSSSDTSLSHNQLSAEPEASETPFTTGGGNSKVNPLFIAPQDQPLSYPIHIKPIHNIISRQFSLLSFSKHISQSIDTLDTFRNSILALINLLKVALEFEEAPYQKWRRRKESLLMMGRKDNDGDNALSTLSPLLIDSITWKQIKQRVQQNTTLNELKYKRWYFEDLNQQGGSFVERTLGAISQRPISRVEPSKESDVSTALTMSSEKNKSRPSLGETKQQKLNWLPLEIEYIVRKNTKRLHRNLLRLEGRLPYEQMVQMIDSSQELDIFKVLDRCEEVTQSIYMKHVSILQVHQVNEELKELRSQKRKYMELRAINNKELKDQLTKTEYVYCVAVLRRKIELFLEKHVFADRQYHIALRYVNLSNTSYQSALKWLTRTDPFADIPEHILSSGEGKNSGEDDVSPLSNDGRAAFLRASPIPTSSSFSKKKKLQRTGSNTSLKSTYSNSGGKSPSNNPNGGPKSSYDRTDHLWKKLDRELGIHEDPFMVERVKTDINTIFEHLYLPEATLQIGPEHFSGDLGKFETFKAILKLFDDSRPNLQWESVDEDDFL